MEPLEIVRLQVQREPLKQGRPPARAYDPTHLVAVPAIELGASGAHGVTAGGERIIDVHHREHPRTRDAKGRAGVLVMATGDYVALRDRYGPHVVDGIAGESILVEHAPGLADRDLPEVLYLQTSSGTVELQQVRPADPCVEFSRFCLGRPPGGVVDQRIREMLIELDGGARGYRAVAADSTTVRLGDTLLIG